MIEKIVLHNYRSHKDSVVEFSNINAIVGENHHGKTTIFKGILAALLQRDFTERDFFYGEREAFVELHFDDGRIIRRERKGAKQSVILTHSDGKEEVYTTTRGVKPIVEAFSRIAPIPMDKDDNTEHLQIVPAHASAFWLVCGYSSQTILRYVMRLMAGIGIETAKRTLEKESRDLDKEIQVKVGIIKNQEDIVASVDQRLLSDTESHLLALCTLQENLTTMRNFIDKLSKYRKSLLIEEALQVDELESGLVKVQIARNFLKRLTEIRGKVYKVHQELRNLNSINVVGPKICGECGRPL